MCDHKNSKVIKTTGQFYYFKCFDCKYVWSFEKKDNKKKKKSIIKTIRRWYNGIN